MYSKEEEKIQIVAFSTNDSNLIPNDIIQILLDQYTHTIIKKSRHSITFTLVLPDCIKSTKIMICSVLNLNREYIGITNVNCYLYFIDLQNEKTKLNLDSIISYSKDYCDLTKKIFILAIVDKNNDEKIFINKGEIKKIMDSGDLNYEYIELNLEKKKEVADSILKILVKSSNEKSGEVDKNEKSGSQDNSCLIF